MFEAVYTGTYRSQRAALEPEDQADVDRVIRLLELDPWVDGVTKFRAVLDAEAVSLYDDDRWQIVYRVIDNRFIELLGLGRV